MKNLLAIIVFAAAACGAGPATLPTKSESFDQDPKWEGFDNHSDAAEPKKVVQDFGWKDGAVGGQVWRSSTASWYAAKIDANLDQPLSIEATVKITKSGTS